MNYRKKTKLYFAGFFVAYPILLIISSFLWRAFILDKDIGVVATEAFSIVGIYYLIISILSALVYLRNIKLS